MFQLLVVSCQKDQVSYRRARSLRMPPLRQGALTIRERRRPEEAVLILTYRASSGLFFLSLLVDQSFSRVVFECADGLID